jgi:hypothetical protein
MASREDPVKTGKKKKKREISTTVRKEKSKLKRTKEREHF